MSGMALEALLADVVGARIEGPGGLVITEVRDDSRQVQPGDLFVAVAGAVADGRKFVTDAVGRGACAFVVEDRGVGSAPPEPGGATRVVVPDARLALARIAARRHGTTPGAAPTLSAVTGTNGKTTTTYLLEAMWTAAGIDTGVIGTIAYRVGGKPGAPAAAVGGSRSPAGAATAKGTLFEDAPLTTPGPLALHRLLAEMRAAGARDVVLEASSHAIEQRRLEACLFRVAGLTNLTQDHLDYHGSMARYFDAKAGLFERLLEPRHGVAVLPFDRPEGRAMQRRLGAGQPVLGVALAATAETRDAEVVVERAQHRADGLRLHLATPLGPLELTSALVGDFNVANIVLAVGMAIGRGLSKDAIVEGVAGLTGVPGRLQRVANDRGVLAVVDYAHSPDAIERAVAAVRPLVAPGGRLITVFGCGGDRDRGKRPLMGRAALRGSDLVVVTSDNPRSEDPATIIEDIVAGLVEADGSGGAGERFPVAALARTERGFCVEIDRRAAIQAAVAACRPGDVLLLAGKGHETYQILGSRRLHFDDVEEARLAFAAAPDMPTGGAA